MMKLERGEPIPASILASDDAASKLALITVPQVAWLLSIHPDAVAFLRRRPDFPLPVRSEPQPVWLECEILCWRDEWDRAALTQPSWRSNEFGGAA